MSKIWSKEAFVEKVQKYVKKALPEELAEAEVRSANLDLWADGSRTVLLIIRPWNSITTGFCLDKCYQRYLGKTETVETAAAAIINDRRLYCMPQGNDLELEGSIIIYN